MLAHILLKFYEYGLIIESDKEKSFLKLFPEKGELFSEYLE